MLDEELNRKLDFAAKQKSKKIMALLCEILSKYGFYYSDVMTIFFDIEKQNELYCYYKDIYIKQKSDQIEESFVDYIMDKIIEYRNKQNESIRDEIETLFYKEHKLIAKDIDKNGGVSEETKRFKEEIKKRKQLHSHYNSEYFVHENSRKNIWDKRKSYFENMEEVCNSTISDLLEERISKDDVIEQLSILHDIPEALASHYLDKYLGE